MKKVDIRTNGKKQTVDILEVLSSKHFWRHLENPKNPEKLCICLAETVNKDQHDEGLIIDFSEIDSMDIEISKSSKRYSLCSEDFEGIVMPKTFFSGKPCYSFRHGLEKGITFYTQRIHNVSFTDFCKYLIAQEVECYKTEFSPNYMTAIYELDKVTCKITFYSEISHIVFSIIKKEAEL